jgi:hypothetical protein
MLMVMAILTTVMTGPLLILFTGQTSRDRADATQTAARRRAR